PTTQMQQAIFLKNATFDHTDLHSFPTRRSSDLFEEYLLEPDWWSGKRNRSKRFVSPALLPQRSILDLVPRWRSAWRETRSRIERSEEHTSELQSRFELVCRLLLEQKNTR